jgi:hypothetical protein
MNDLIVGEPFGAVQIALRRGLARKAARQPVIVVDYTGRSNAALDLLDRRLLSGRQLQWFNLGDRRRPFNPYVFRAEQGVAAPVLQYLLSAISVGSGNGPLSADLLRWLVAHWLKLIGIGPCDIVGFRASLRSLESTNEFALPEQAERFLEALDGVIATPVLHSSLQAEYVENPVDQLGAKSLLWLEIPTESLDTHEAQLVGVFGRALLGLCIGKAHAQGLRPRGLVESESSSYSGCAAAGAFCPARGRRDDSVARSPVLAAARRFDAAATNGPAAIATDGLSQSRF